MVDKQRLNDCTKTKLKSVRLTASASPTDTNRVNTIDSIVLTQYG